MSKEMQEAIAMLQEAVDQELERKAKLGYNAVIADENGNPIIVPAKDLVATR